ncbi:MAG TPA: autotransporter assembly complex family protein, partial [Candidatus Berkiella sp.]|nr:autotransporter assembly complex family protein [Candidatus Berkiella sp.]
PEQSELDDKVKVQQYEERVTQEVIKAIQPFGYYSPKIVLTTNATEKTIAITVDLGTPVRIQKIMISVVGEGSTDPRLKEIKNEFSLHEGEIFDHTLYEQGKKALLSSSIQNGYLDATFSVHRVEVNLDTHSSDIYLTLDTQQRHYFGSVNYHETVLSEKLLNRYLPFQTGDVYSPEKLLKLQSRLAQSDYFSEVNVKPQTTPDSNVVPIQVELKDAKPNRYLLGAGYGTDTGLRGKAAWTRRRLNSMGHRLNAEARVSEVYDKFELDYIIPGKQPATDTFAIHGSYFEEEYTEKLSQLYEAGFTQIREINTWQRKLAIAYLHESYTAYITNEPIQSNLILPSVTFTQIKRDNTAAPTRGRRIEINLRGSVDALVSDTSFFQAYLQCRWLHAFNEPLKALARTELGFTLPDDSERLPLSQRFFAGGDLSIRGYGYRSLPNEIDKEGNRLPVGGAYLGIVSFEVVKTIKKPFGVLAFIDAGNAFRHFGDQIEVGTGVGIEWQTRLGPVKFAIAKPLNKDSEAWRI